MGVPELRVQSLSHDFSDTDPGGSYAEIREYAEAEALWGDAHADALGVYEESARLAEELGVNLRLLDVVKPEGARASGTPGCDWPWRAAYVTADAEVQPCCMIMGTDRAVLGDADREGIDGVWTNDAYRRFRQSLLGDEPPEVCRGCSWYRGVF